MTMTTNPNPVAGLTRGGHVRPVDPWPQPDDARDSASAFDRRVNAAMAYNARAAAERERRATASGMFWMWLLFGFALGALAMIAVTWTR